MHITGSSDATDGQQQSFITYTYTLHTGVHDMELDKLRNMLIDLELLSRTASATPEEVKEAIAALYDAAMTIEDH
jgi:hypothetical protein